MTHGYERPGTRDWFPASLQAALEELAALPVDVTAARTIAIAIGILIERYQISPEEGFDLVLAISQQTQRRPCDVASDLAVGGELESQQTALRLAPAG